jgi:hypothetical protein
MRWKDHFPNPNDTIKTRQNENHTHALLYDILNLFLAHEDHEQDQKKEDSSSVVQTSFIGRYVLGVSD